MEDFLPLLIGLIWLGFTLYGKNRKNKTAKSGSQTDEKRPSILEQLLLGEQFETVFQSDTEPADSIYDNFDKKAAEKEYEIENNDTFEEDSPFLKYELSNFIEEGKQMTKKKNDSFFEEKTLASEDVNNSQLIDIDLRRAVIYSEILNAPYI